MKAKLASAERSRLSTFGHALAQASRGLAHAEVFAEDFDDTVLLEARDTWNEAAANFWAALYEPIDVDPIKDRGRS